MRLRQAHDACRGGTSRYSRALFRTGGRVAEGARLESVWTGNRLVGSNPTLSAILLRAFALRRTGTPQVARSRMPFGASAKKGGSMHYVYLIKSLASCFALSRFAGPAHHPPH